MDSDTNTQAPGAAGARPPSGGWLRRAKDLVPTLSVFTVVVTALAATVMVTREDWQEASRPPVMAKAGQDVVRAPPLVVKAPPAKANALGAGPACRNCGVVESVALPNQQGAFQVRIRMDDGSLRTVEQSGPVAAGARVLLEGKFVRVLQAGPRQG
jgi:hypothetical protein